MAAPPQPLRVLQIIGDTDASEVNQGALALHRDLVGIGVEVRTLALAPGREGGLDDLVPVMAPSRRSWTLRRVLDREARWADVTLLHGRAAVVPGTRRRTGRPPVVAVLSASDQDEVPGPVDVDVVVVVTTGPAAAASPGQGHVRRLVAPVDAAAWQELLTDHAARSR